MGRAEHLQLTVGTSHKCERVIFLRYVIDGIGPAEQTSGRLLYEARAVLRTLGKLCPSDFLRPDFYYDLTARSLHT